MTTAFLSRRFRPAAMALMLAAFSVALTWTTTDRFEGNWDMVMGSWALLVGLLLFAGWLVNKDGLMMLGLLVSVVLWGFVSWTAFVTLAAYTSGLIAIAWMVLAAGTYWLERRYE
jgi:hypothetical protein